MPTTILLVEDSDDDAFFFTRTLEKTGATLSCVRARNGIEAQNYVTSHPDLDLVIFLDIKLPCLNGLEFLEWFQKHSANTRQRVIVLSGSDAQRDIKQAFQTGSLYYMVKPISVSDLNECLAACNQPNPQTD